MEKDSKDIDERGVTTQLERILSSAEFKATKRQKDFLKFVVGKTLAGKAGEIKAFTIATTLFGRDINFDQNKDGIVSAEANRLRKALDYYYVGIGRKDPLRIEIPKGAYVPVFSKNISQPFEPVFTGELSDHYAPDNWPSVLIQPFQNLSGEESVDSIAHGFTTELAIELARYQDIQVLMKPPGTPVDYVEPHSRFVIDGSVRQGTDRIKVAIQLLDRKLSKQMWANAYECDLKVAELITFQQDVAQIIAATVAEEEGFISKTLSIESTNKPCIRSPWNWMIRWQSPTPV